MSADRLSGLAHIKINRSRCDKLHKSQSELGELVHEFGQLHPRRMKLPFLFGRVRRIVNAIMSLE